MQQTRKVRVSEHDVTYFLRKRRGHKRMTLSVKRDGTIILTVPKWVTVGMAERYMLEKRTWLAEALAHVVPPLPAVEGWGEGPRIGGGGSVVDRTAHYKKHKESARVLVHDLLYEVNRQYGFSWGRVAIRMNTSRWGSCSSKGNLNFDYRILFLPPYLQKYLVVHELCHLVEMNHSPRFWALVEQAVPAYAEYRTELRTILR